MRSLSALIESSTLSVNNILAAHSWRIKAGTVTEVYTANNILSGYAKCGQLGLAQSLFDEMPHRDTVSCNTMIGGYVNSGKFETALEVYKDMQRFGFKADLYSYGSILKGVASTSQLRLGRQVHSKIVKLGYEGNIYAGSALLNMYAKCDRVDDAYEVFQCIPERNSVSWNALIAGFAQVGDCETAFCLFDCMERGGARLDDGTFAPLMTMLDNAEFYNLTNQMHAKIIKHGLTLYNTVCNAAITAYSTCGSIEDARKVFGSAVTNGDLVTWNSMLAAYAAHGKEELTFKLFLDMQALGFEPDMYTYTSVTSACFEEAHKNRGKSLHALVMKRGLVQTVPISNALIAMYLKSYNKSVEDALSVFESMESKDRVSWNSILTGLSQFGSCEDALKFFSHMRSLQVEIDQYAFSAVLRSCSDLATLQLSQQVHALTIKSSFESNDYVGSSLIFTYSKCGIVEDARKSFDETPKDTAITWNSIIFAYAQHGQGNVALDLFFLMRERKVKLDHITFVAVLTACSHAGLVEEGFGFLKSMESDYGIPPRMEHYACAVDLFGRAGLLDKALALIESMPFEPDTMVWKTLMGACRICGNIELAGQVATHLLDLEPEEHCVYVLLSNMFGRLKKWDDKASITRLMRERKVRKVPGWSWIEVKNQVHAFNAEDRSHLNSDEIYQRLGELTEEIMWFDTLARSDVLLDFLIITC